MVEEDGVSHENLTCPRPNPPPVLLTADINSGLAEVWGEGQGVHDDQLGSEYSQLLLRFPHATSNLLPKIKSDLTIGIYCIAFISYD